MNIREYVQKTIGIDYPGTFDKGTFVIELENSDQYGVCFNRLSQCEDVILEESKVTPEITYLKYESKTELYYFILESEDGVYWTFTAKENNE